MSDVKASIVEPSPAGISKEDRRWAILQWLSVKMVDAPHEEVLKAACDFEDFIVRDVADRDISDNAISSITMIDPKAGQIPSGTAKKKRDPASESKRAAPREMLDRMGRS